MSYEPSVITNGGRPVARATARMMAAHARALLRDAEKILAAAGEDRTADIAFQAKEATTELISATYDGDAAVFACKR